MSLAAWLACSAWVAVSLALAAALGTRAIRAGNWPAAATRLKSPTVYLFAAYLLVAALVAPRSSGESTSPLLGLAIVVPFAYVAATLSAAGRARSSLLPSLGLAILHGGAVLAAAAIILALSSPTFVPAWLR